MTENNKWCIDGINPLKGEITIPADKSVSHRSIIFASLARGTTHIKNFLASDDCMRTLEAFKKMGISIEGPDTSGNVMVVGVGLKGLKAPSSDLYLGNSGTSMRLLPGVLGAQNFTSKLTCDASLSKRPMKRIIDPMKLMGIEIESSQGMTPPLTVKPSKGNIKAIDYVSKIASAQVKTCILLAGLYAEGKTSFTEPHQSRDHTEKMLKHFSVPIEKQDLKVSVGMRGIVPLIAKNLVIPGDISSAAFFVSAALITPGSDILLKDVGVNPSRIGLLSVFKRMGAEIETNNIRNYSEPIADLRVKYSDLKGARVMPDEIPLLVDEVPALAAAACFAEGETIIKGIGELRLKETDRVASMIDNLSRMGANIKAIGDEIIIYGSKNKLKPSTFDTFDDHRTAMSMVIASNAMSGKSMINGTDCISTSYPNFYSDFIKATL